MRKERRKKNILSSNFSFSENKGIYIIPVLKTLKLYAPIRTSTISSHSGESPKALRIISCKMDCVLL